MVVVEVMGMVVVLLARPTVVNSEDFLAGAGGFCILTVCSRESKLVRAVEAVLEVVVTNWVTEAYLRRRHPCRECDSTLESKVHC